MSVALTNVWPLWIVCEKASTYAAAHYKKHSISLLPVPFQKLYLHESKMGIFFQNDAIFTQWCFFFTKFCVYGGLFLVTLNKTLASIQLMYCRPNKDSDFTVGIARKYERIINNKYGPLGQSNLYVSFKLSSYLDNFFIDWKTNQKK